MTTYLPADHCEREKLLRECCRDNPECAAEKASLLRRCPLFEVALEGGRLFGLGAYLMAKERR